MVVIVRGLDAHIGERQILKDIDLDIEAGDGKVICIVGGIGAGKSTLANFLALSTSQTTLQKLSGVTYTCKVNSKSPDVGFLPPVDALLSTLTVFEFLLHRSLQTDPRRQHKIDYHRIRTYQIIEEMGISYLTSTVIGHGMEDNGGISGGEKRRVSIASELLFTPEFMVLDEPTTGLDSMASLMLLKSLKQLATRRKMVVLLSIHHVSPVYIKMGYIDETIGMKDGTIINRLAHLKEHVSSNGNSLDWMYQPDSSRRALRTNYNDWIPQLYLKRPIQFCGFARRHAVMRWRMTNTLWVWCSRLAIAVLASMCYWEVFYKNESRNLFDHKGILFVLLMHFQYEALYMAQANMDEERMCYSYEMARGMINPLTLSLGRLPGEFLMNVVNIVPYTTVLMVAGWGWKEYPTNLLLSILYYLLFTTVISSMWKMTGMWFRDYRRSTWIGDLYINITMQVSGFWVPLATMAPSGLWLRYVSAISQTFNILAATTITPLTYSDTDADGVTTVTSGAQMLTDDGLTVHRFASLGILIGLFVVFELLSILGAKYGRAFRFRS